ERYDLLNLLLSLGMDRSWRAEAAREAFAAGASRVLDVATGTGDLALCLKRTQPTAEVVGVDFAQPMLDIARRKAAAAGQSIRLDLADALALPYVDDHFGALTIAYGLRNLSDLSAGLREFHRVLEPGGRLVVLEFPPPPTGPLGRLYQLYFLHVVPWMGGLVSGSRGAYQYLPDSVLAFPEPRKLAALMQEAGFQRVRYKLQTFGVSALHIGEKP
ncbi:MAG TPA: bifunctional demethylmenaquinone methyltransferase/2-methoxy-6-polyprenyl-1,4-benzoquinol methylase UbiE, partial [Trueperaceae bacterium]